jgi:hypothetical protein
MPELNMDLTIEERRNEASYGCPWRSLYLHDGGVYYQCTLDGFDCKESYKSFFNCLEED